MLTGTIVNYYYHCKRQCWLFYHRLNLEDNSEDVRIGRVLHELKKDVQSPESIDGIMVDKITPEYVVEMKKSDADIEAGIAQLKFYLMALREKGIMREGILTCLEKNKDTKKDYYVQLNDADVAELKEEYEKIERFLNKTVPPDPSYEKKCKKCAYYEYCFI